MSVVGTRPLVLLTRPEDRAAPLATTLASLGIDTLIWPVLDIHPTLTKAPALDAAQAVLLTSPRAVEALPDQTGAPIEALTGALTAAPAFCVGTTTAAAAQTAGFSNIYNADGDAADLAALITSTLAPDDGPLLYVRGRDVARDMAALLPAFDVRAVEAYHAAPMTTPTPAVINAINAGYITTVAFFSPRAAAIFASAATDEMRKGLATTTAVVMSERVAAKVNQIAFQRVIIAERPSGAAMYAAICGACGIAARQNGVCD
jgi:uroporphyrinogen-III synthase